MLNSFRPIEPDFRVFRFWQAQLTTMSTLHIGNGLVRISAGMVSILLNSLLNRAEAPRLRCANGMCSDRIHEIAPNRMPAHWPVSGPRECCVFLRYGPSLRCARTCFRSSARIPCSCAAPGRALLRLRRLGCVHRRGAPRRIPTRAPRAGLCRHRSRSLRGSVRAGGLRTGLVRKKWGLRSG